MTVKTSALSGAWEGYGGFWIRLLAYLVDSVILLIALLLVAAGSTFLGDLGGLVVTIVYFVGPLLYWSMMHASKRQATYGKALLGLKVTDGGRKRISFVRSLARELAKIISAFTLMIGFILAGLTKRKQALHDFFVNTTVMREGPSHVVAALAIGVLGWLAPVGIVMFLGIGMFMGAGGLMGGDLMAQVMQEAQKQAAAQQRPMPPRMPQKPPAAQVVAKAAPPPPPPAPAPAPVVTPAPAPVPVAAPKPEPIPVVEAKPKPKPVAVAAAKPKPRARPKPAVAPPITAVALPPQPVEAPVPAPKPAPTPAQQIELKTASGATKYNDLMTAVLYRDLAGLNELLAFGKWPDKPDSRGVTPLMAAAALGDLDNAEALLRAGAVPSRALEVARDRGDGAMMTLLEKYRK